MPSSEGQDASSENTSGEDTPDADTPDADAPDADALDEDVPREDASGGEDSLPEQVVETVECPNCGRIFTGTYCPECGQEADPSTSVVEVIGGFFRELVDLESGFWPTFVGLTVRPGGVLRDYLSGIRAGLISPGRYLLAAVVVDVGTDRLLAWIGAESLPWENSEAPSPENGETEEGVGKVISVALDQMGPIFEGPQTRIIGVLLVVGLLAVLLYRLFQDTFGRIGEALAVASFLVAHVAFLAGAAGLLYTLLAFLFTGNPVTAPGWSGFVLLLGYIGLASYKGFSPDWKSALKGTFAGLWAVVETFSVALTLGLGYAVGLTFIYPDRYVPPELPTWGLLLVFAILGIVFAFPLLLHVGVEVYHRWGR